MKKIKTSLVVAGASLIFIGGSAVGFASTTWVGHQNEITTQNNLHKLGDQLQTNQQKMDDSKQ